MRRPRAAGVWLLAILVLAGALGIAVSWAPDRPVSALQARWAQPPSTFVAVAGMQVHVRDEGVRDDPQPLVLLHGTSASLHTWNGWTRLLAPRHRVIRFDLPGFGLTGPFPDDDYGIAHYVAFTHALLDTMRVEHCVLVGNSFGGEVAWETALAEPERVEALILVDAVGYPLHPQQVPIGFRIARTPVLNRLMDYTLPRALVARSVRAVYGDPERVTPELVDRYYDLTLAAGNRHALTLRLAQAQPGADAVRIATLQLPTLILWGGRDRLLPPADGAHFHADIPGSKLVVFDGLGHVPQEEDAAATVAAAEHFLEAL